MIEIKVKEHQASVSAIGSRIDILADAAFALKALFKMASENTGIPYDAIRGILLHAVDESENRK